MKRIILLLLAVPLIAWALPSEQDRAVLEKGNRELLSNPGFEGRLSEWTATGSSTLTLESVAPANGKLHGKWTASATGEYLQSPAISVPIKLQGKNKCSASLDYKWAGVQGELKLEIYDGSSVIAEAELSPSPTLWANLPIQVTCPTSGTIQWRLASTAASLVIEVDDAHLGEMEDISVSQTELVANAFYAGTASCFSATASGTFPAVAACPAITVVSSSYAVNTADNDELDLLFDNLPKGKYELSVIAHLGLTIAAQNISYNIIEVNSGQISSSCGSSLDNSGNVDGVPCKGTFDFPTSGARAFKLQGLASSGSTQLINSIASTFETSFTLVKYPTEVSEAITLETSGYHVDVNIGGANPAMGTVNNAANTVASDPNLSMVINPGSSPAEIPCVGAASTGLVCGGSDEIMGASFNILEAGRYAACLTGSSFQSLGINSAIRSTIRIAETNNADDTILKLGEDVTTIRLGTAGESGDHLIPFKNCANFTFNSVGKKTIKLMKITSSVVGTISSHVLLADRGAPGEDFHFTVEKLDEQKPTPVFTDLQDSFAQRVSSEPGLLSQKVVFAEIGCSASPTINRNPGGWVDSVVGVAGNCSLAFAATFNNEPFCVCTTETSGAVSASCIANASVGSNVLQQFIIRNLAGTATSANLHIVCIGE